MSKPTIESIIKKLGYDPIDVNQCPHCFYEDDSRPNPYEGLTNEEINLIMELASNDPRARISNCRMQ